MKLSAPNPISAIEPTASPAAIAIANSATRQPSPTQASRSQALAPTLIGEGHPSAPSRRA
jgi:hypothetical protein